MMMMMMESGFSSPRAAESFPAGLRVLVVDDDPTWLKILEKMLKKCSYEVTTCGLAREALRLLRERKEGFDIVISDVNMPDMDGFKLLEHVGLEMDLPVIMMSVDGETSRVMKGVQHGACDYLLKPIRMKELKNIWQHVFRKRMHEIRDIESHDNFDDDDFHLFKYAADLSDGGHVLTSCEQTFLRKRKDLDSKHGDKDSNDSSSKRPRVVWSIDLHQKFVRAVNQIGFDKVGPKRILDLMNVPWLTRENVASHLQKYRLYLSRLGKNNESKSACGGRSKNSDQSPKDSGGGFGIHNPNGMQQAEPVVANLRCPDYKPPVKNVDGKPREMGPTGINVWPLTETEIPFSNETAGVHKATICRNMGLDCSLGSPRPKISSPTFDSSLASQFTWSRAIQHSPFEFEYKPHQQQALEMPFVDECKPVSRIEEYFSNQMTVHVPQQHIQADLQQPATCISRGQSVSDRDNGGIIDSKLLSPEFSSNVIEQPLHTRQPTGSVSQSESCALNIDIFGSNSSTSLDFNPSASQNGLTGLDLGSSNHISAIESSLGSLTDELGLYLPRGDSFATTSIGFDNLGLSGYNFPDLINGANANGAPSVCLYGVPRYNFECFGDSVESAADQPIHFMTDIQLSQVW